MIGGTRLLQALPPGQTAPLSSFSKDLPGAFSGGKMMRRIALPVPSAISSRGHSMLIYDMISIGEVMIEGRTGKHHNAQPAGFPYACINLYFMFTKIGRTGLLSGLSSFYGLRYYQPNTGQSKYKAVSTAGSVSSSPPWKAVSPSPMNWSRAYRPS